MFFLKLTSFFASVSLAIGTMIFLSELPILSDLEIMLDWRDSFGSRVDSWEIYLFAGLILGVLSEICAHLYDIHEKISPSSLRGDRDE